MAPKEKARELYFKYYQQVADGSFSEYNAKQCALIAVDEILDVDCYDMSEELFDNHIDYWEQVKHEINKL